MLTAIAAYVFAALVFIVVGFQVALAAGAPWGELTWGGRFPGRLPGRMRVAAVITALILICFALTVAARGGLAFSAWSGAARVAIWFVVAYCAIGTLANAATPSKRERLIWLPVVVLMLICSTLVALS